MSFHNFNFPNSGHTLFISIKKIDHIHLILACYFKNRYQKNHFYTLEAPLSVFKSDINYRSLKSVLNISLYFVYQY